MNLETQNRVPIGYEEVRDVICSEGYETFTVNTIQKNFPGATIQQISSTLGYLAKKGDIFRHERIVEDGKSVRKFSINPQPAPEYDRTPERGHDPLQPQWTESGLKANIMDLEAENSRLRDVIANLISRLSIEDITEMIINKEDS